MVGGSGGESTTTEFLSLTFARFSIAVPSCRRRAHTYRSCRAALDASRVRCANRNLFILIETVDSVDDTERLPPTNPRVAATRFPERGRKVEPTMTLPPHLPASTPTTYSDAIRQQLVLCDNSKLFFLRSSEIRYNLFLNATRRPRPANRNYGGGISTARYRFRI